MDPLVESREQSQNKNRHIRLVYRRFFAAFSFGTHMAHELVADLREILFDEKIGGSFHLALGASYPETGGKNESAIHWDMICDLRDGGEIRVDGELLYLNGKLVIE